MPKVSVIVPNYNHARFLEQRIESVLNQTFQDFELILLDDFSTDNSRIILEKYKNHPKISYLIFNQQNSGSTFIQWEKGIKLAKGELIWIAESDDSCEPIFLELALSKIEANIGVFYAQAKWVNEDNKSIDRPKIIAHFLDKEDRILAGNVIVTQEMTIRNVINNTSGVVFQKKLLEDSFKSYLKYKYCGDWLFWCHIFRDTTVYCSAQTLNILRIHKSSVTNSFDQSYLHILETFSVLNYISSTFPIKLKEQFLSIKYWIIYWQVAFPFRWNTRSKQLIILKKAIQWNGLVPIFFIAYSFYKFFKTYYINACKCINARF